MTSYEQCKCALQKIIAEYGKAIVQDTDAFFRLIKEEFPALVKERKRLQLAFLEGIADDLFEYQLRNSTMDPMLFNRMAERLSDSYGMTIEDARDIVNLIWYMLSGVDELQKAREERDCSANLLLAIERAQQGDEEAICAFADRKYLFQDEQLMNHLIKINKLALQGNPYAQVILSEEYERGRFLPKNMELSYLWAKAAAENGNCAGKMRLSVCYYRGIPEKKDSTATMYVFEKAVCEGYWENVEKTFDIDFISAAKKQLSILSKDKCEKVIHVRKRIAKEAESDLVRTFSCMALGDILGKYFVSDQGYTEAAYWYAKAAESEAPDALWKWAMYRNNCSLFSEKQECDLTISLMEKAADSNAQYAIKMAAFYSEKISITSEECILETLKSGKNFLDLRQNYQSQKKGEYWFSRFVECTEEIMDVDEAKNVFQIISKERRSSYIDRLLDRKKISDYVAGMLYLWDEERRNSDNILRAITLLEQAAKENDYKACDELARLYEKGTLVTENPAKTFFYLEREYSLVDKETDEVERKRVKERVSSKLFIEYFESPNIRPLATFWDNKQKKSQDISL